VIEDEISHRLLISSTGINFSNGVVMKKLAGLQAKKIGCLWRRLGKPHAGNN